MGNYPVSLEGWAKYCDCLEDIVKFNHKKSEESSISESSEIDN